MDVRVELRVADVMTTSVVGCAPDAGLVEAASIMSRQGASVLVLVKGGRVRGVVTERDIVTRCVARGVDLGRALVGDARPDDVPTVGLATPVHEALGTLDGTDADALLVVEDGVLVGVVRREELTGGDHRLAAAVQDRHVSRAR